MSFLLFFLHTILVYYYCVCTQKRISIISLEFSHTLTVLSDGRRVKNTCYRARALLLLLLFLLILDHGLLHGWPQGIFVSLLCYYYFSFRNVHHQIIFVLRSQPREWCQSTLTLLCSHLRSRPRTPFIFSSISICGL